MRILALSGSLRAASYNTALARAAIELAPAGVEIELYEGLAWIPPYDGDDDGEDPPATVGMLREQIREVDGLLVVTPEYNGSVPGVLKNAIDWASRPHRESALWGKTVAIAGATTGQYGAIWAQQDLRRVLGLAGARVVEGELPVARAHEKFDDEGQLVDPVVAERLRAHVGALVAEAAGAVLTAA
jgi:chromate reductase, NAD(P)H dehydrogenase (quinone)